MSKIKKSSRRDFLKSSSAVTAGAALAGGLSVARTAHAQGSGQIKAALIGCGGRGNGAAVNFLNVQDDVKIVAVADAFENNAKGAANGLRGRGEKVDIPDERIFVGFDAYKQAIDCGVDMVILATPPGFRPIHYKAAIEAGKNVFMEKPCCTDAPGFRSLMETNKLVDEKGLKVGVGLQRHHQAPYIEGIKQIHDGSLGKIQFLRAYWNGGAIWVRGRKPDQTEMEYQMRNWYHFTWVGGDNIVEQHVHNLDICNWVMTPDLFNPVHPVEANGMGGCQVRDNRNIGLIFDHHAVEFTYADGTKMFSQSRQINGCSNNVSEAAHGTEGSSNCTARAQGGNPFNQEHVDLVAAIRADAKYNEGWYGATSSMTAVLGRMATYSGKVVRWDDAVANGRSLQPDVYAWDADPPVMPDADGYYPEAVPGVYKPY